MSDSFLNEVASVSKRLHQHWMNTRSVWKDKRAQKFESHSWKTIEKECKSLTDAARDLSQTLREARRACEG